MDPIDGTFNFLPQELQYYVLDGLPYSRLYDIARTVHNRTITMYLDHVYLVIKDKLNIHDIEKHELIERVYYMNEYNNWNLDGITINSNGWTKGNSKIAKFCGAMNWTTKCQLHRLYGPACIEHYSHNGNIRYEGWFNHGLKHREGKPATINYTASGAKESEEWYINDLLHRKGGPAIISYYNGNVISEQWYINNEYYRETGPTHISYHYNGAIRVEEWHARYNMLVHERTYHNNGNMEKDVWYKNRMMHRTDGPAVTTYYENGVIKSLSWFINEMYHRANGPANISYNINGCTSSVRWYKNNMLHREDGPAVTTYHANGAIEHLEWYINDVNHREDGPAIIHYNDNGDIILEEWYNHGDKIAPN